MRVSCEEFYDGISITITTHGRIDHWSETLQRHEKSNLRQRAKSSPSHKSAAYIIGIDEPHNFVAVAGFMRKMDLLLRTGEFGVAESSRR